MAKRRIAAQRDVALYLFESALKVYTATIERHNQEVAALNYSFRLEVTAAHIRLFPKKKDRSPQAWDKDFPELVKGVQDALDPKVIAVREGQRQQAKRLKDLLHFLADQATLVRSGKYRLVETCHDSNYRSQGWGCTKYAKVDAEECVRKLKLYGIPSRIERRSDLTAKNSWGTKAAWEVMAPLSDLMLEVFHYKHGISNEEWFKLCKEKCAHPNVLNPFLPREWVKEGMGW